VACDRCGAPAVEWLRYSGEHLCRAHFLEFVERRVKREFRSQVDLRGGDEDRSTLVDWSGSRGVRYHHEPIALGDAADFAAVLGEHGLTTIAERPPGSGARASRPGSETNFLRKPAALARIVRGHHRIVGRQPPAFTVGLGRHVVGSLQVPF